MYIYMYVSIYVYMYICTPTHPQAQSLFSHSHTLKTRICAYVYSAHRIPVFATGYGQNIGPSLSGHCKYVEVCCSVLQYVTVKEVDSPIVRGPSLSGNCKCVEVCCSELQCVALCCSVLQ